VPDTVVEVWLLSLTYSIWSLTVLAKQPSPMRMEVCLDVLYEKLVAAIAVNFTSALS
jgi:hypothetical protein